MCGADGRVVVAVTNMSGWDAHINQIWAAPMALPAQAQAAIYDHQGTQWTTVNVPVFAAGELQYIIAGFANPGSLFAAGPKVNGVKHMATRATDDLIVLKKETNGAVFVKCKQTVVAVVFKEDHCTPAAALVAAQKFGDYLKGMGY